MNLTLPQHITLELWPIIVSMNPFSDPFLTKEIASVP
jgi:hypothetical protein